MRTSGSTGMSCSVHTSGWSRPTSHSRSRVPAGTSTPTALAITAASLPTKSLFAAPSRPGPPASLITRRVTAAVCSAFSSKAPCFFICALSSSAIEATASTSFSSMQMTLLSRLAPLTMSRPAFARSAVSSTTTGGLPGPAAITFFALFIAARTTAGPPVTTSRLTWGCSKSFCARLDRGLDHRAQHVGRPPRPLDRLVQEGHRARAHAFGRRVGVEHHGVARRHHAEGVVEDRLRGVGARRDGARPPRRAPAPPGSCRGRP